MSDIEATKQRFSAFLAARLSSPAAKAEWRANLELGYRELGSRTLGDVLPQGALLKCIEIAKRPELYEKVVSKIAAAVHAEAYPRVVAHRATLGSYVPDDAKKKIDLLLARPNLVNPTLIREMLAQEAMKDLMEDVLEGALKEFNQNVNPFFADWGIPAIVKKVMPIGSGAVLKSLESVRAEFDKRLDPEIKKFLGAFSKKALDRTATLMTEKGDSPKFVELRKAVAAWLYAQPIGDLTKGADAEAVKLGQEAGVLVAARVAASKDLAQEVEASIAAFYKKHETESLDAIRKAYGIDYAPDFDALAEATWPIVERAASSATLNAWAASVVGEFLSQEAATPPLS